MRPTKLTVSSLIALTLAASLVGGCSASLDDADDSVDVGEDAIVGTVLGSSTGSAYASPNGRYYTERDLRSLESLVDSDTDAVLLRADGIVANQPPNGRVSLAELRRLEDPAYFKFLAPSEKAALPSAWKALQAPTNKPAAGLAAPSMAWPPSVVVQESAPLVDPNESVPLATVPGDKNALKRLELGYDVDGDPSTVAMKDCLDAIANPLPFSPSEIATFRTVEARLRETLVARGSVTASGPKPTTTSKAYASLAGVKIRIVRDFGYFERRNHTHAQPLATQEVLTARLEAAMMERIEVSLPPDVTVVTVSVSPTGAASSNILRDSAELGRWGGAGTADVAAPVLEIWQKGKRLGSRALPTLQAMPAPLDLSFLVDVPLKAGNADLVRNAKYGAFEKGYTAVGFMHELVAAPPRDGATPSVLAEVSLPTTSIPSGVYDLSKAPIALSGRLVVYGPTVVAWAPPNAKPGLAAGTRWTTFVPSVAPPLRGDGPSQKAWGITTDGWLYESSKDWNGNPFFSERFIVQPGWRDARP